MLSTYSQANDKSASGTGKKDGPLLTDEITKSAMEGRLSGYECLDCKSRGIEVQAFCARCGSSRIRIIDLETKGKVITYTIQNVAPDQFLKDVPYAWAVIELDGNIRTTGWIPSIRSPDDLGIGQRVSLTKSDKSGMVFQKVSEE